MTATGRAPAPGTLAPPQRLAVKLYVVDPGSFDRRRPIDIFHRWIRDDVIPGLPVDVHDYTHMPDGPGVLLVAHEGHLRTDETDGRVGLEYEWKREGSGSIRKRIAHTLVRVSEAATALERETAGAHPVRIGTREIRLRFTDRLAVPATDEGFGELRAILDTVLSRLYPDAELRVERVGGSKEPLTVRVTVPDGQAPGLASLLARAREVATSEGSGP